MRDALDTLCKDLSNRLKQIADISTELLSCFEACDTCLLSVALPAYHARFLEASETAAMELEDEDFEARNRRASAVRVKAQLQECKYLTALQHVISGGAEESPGISLTPPSAVWSGVSDVGGMPVMVTMQNAALVRDIPAISAISTHLSVGIADTLGYDHTRDGGHDARGRALNSVPISAPGTSRPAGVGRDAARADDDHARAGVPARAYDGVLQVAAVQDVQCLSLAAGPEKYSCSDAKFQKARYLQCG
ncbi:hypothetical protein GGX14DRAFT_575695 [Mycena pura]|uniref:Uncharacterized protein n=1 Tax=Mycena pura TaxID=153505 RepID=A0AAD6Y3Y8_9AGAR|nr:hypothetical protein GGX14DRAFT_575695 [Mycena pura]